MGGRNLEIASRDEQTYGRPEYCQSPYSRFGTLTLLLTVQRAANENISFLWPGDGFVFSILNRMGLAATLRRGWVSCCWPLAVFPCSRWGPVLAARSLVSGPSPSRKICSREERPGIRSGTSFLATGAFEGKPTAQVSL